MNQILQGFVSRVFRIRVQGQINQKLADNIARGLNKSWPYRPQALLVTINSPGGSIVQAKSISDLLRVYSNRYNVPIITFAEDQCLNSANVILTTGVRCCASSYSMVGDLGYTWSSLWFNRFANKYDIKQEYIYTPQNKVKLNPFEQIKPESQKWMQNYLFEMEHELKTSIANNREAAFLKNGLTKESIEDKVFNIGITSPRDYLKVGLLDELRTFDQQIKERYSSAKVKQVNPPEKSFRHRMRSLVAMQ